MRVFNDFGDGRFERLAWLSPRFATLAKAASACSRTRGETSSRQAAIVAKVRASPLSARLAKAFNDATL